MAVNQSATIARGILKVYNSYAQAPTHEAGVRDAAEEAAKEVAATAISNVVQSGSREGISSVSQTIGKAVGVSVGNEFGAGEETVEILARETARHAMEGGIDGFLSWAVDRTVR